MSNLRPLYSDGGHVPRKENNRMLQCIAAAGQPYPAAPVAGCKEDAYAIWAAAGGQWGILHRLGAWSVAGRARWLMVSKEL